MQPDSSRTQNQRRNVVSTVNVLGTACGDTVQSLHTMTMAWMIIGVSLDTPIP